MIVGLVGKKRCGKDTAADHFVQIHNFIKYSLADPMKRAVKDIFLLSDEQLWGNQKEALDARYNTTARKILQVFGTELFQYDIYKHIPELAQKVPPRKIWINRFVQWYKKECGCEYIHSIEALNQVCVESLYYTKDTTKGVAPPDVVISDVRFPHEAEEIKKLDGIIIRIYRNNLPNTDNHASEQEMEEISHDYMILNDGTKDDLYKKIDKLIGEILWKNIYIDS